MRLRVQLRIRKILRRMRGPDRSVALAVAGIERRRLPLAKALVRGMLDPALHWQDRAAMAKLLSTSGDNRALEALLSLFFQQTGGDELYCTALTLETLNDRRAVPPLIRALLSDDNRGRRRAAARALGWMESPGRRAAMALAACLTDPAQPESVREEAAESLAYIGTPNTVEALILAVSDQSVNVRFWSVFALGSACGKDPRVVEALESRLDDREIPPGNLWPVGQEALAMLGRMQPPLPAYKARLASEIERVLTDPGSTPADRRWAEFYDHSAFEWRCRGARSTAAN